MRDRQRDNSISAIRFLAMIMIISCHFMQYLNIELAWWFNVGVQLFFVISGFLYGGKTISNPLMFYKKSFVKILLPYWIFLIIVVIVQSFLIPDMFSCEKVILAFICVERLDGIEHLWFVQTILICYLLLPLLLTIKAQIMKKTMGKAILWTLLCLLMLQFVGFSFNGYEMIPNRITCFAMGIVLSGIYQRKGSIAKQCFIFVIIALVMNAIRIYFHYIRGLTDNQLLNLFERYAHGVLGIALFLILYQVLKKVRDNKILKFSDRYSYYIYLVHQIFILGPLTLMDITPYTAVNILIIVVCIIVSGVALERVSFYLGNKLKRHLNLS